MTRGMRGRYGGLLAGERGEWELAEKMLQRAVAVQGDLEGAEQLLQMLKAQQVHSANPSTPNLER